MGKARRDVGAERGVKGPPEPGLQSGRRGSGARSPVLDGGGRGQGAGGRRGLGRGARAAVLTRPR